MEPASKKHYENKEIGIAFDYPPDWIEVNDKNIKNGVDVMMYSSSVAFGIMRATDSKLNLQVPIDFALEKILRDIIKSGDKLLEEPKLDKYPIRNGRSGTIVVKRSYDDGGGDNKENDDTGIHERTFVINDKRDRCFTVLLEYDLNKINDLDSTIKTQSQLKGIFNSFRFI